MDTSSQSYSNTVLGEAIKYARLGAHVFPLHHITNGGCCSCSNLNCRSPGKHPRTLNGFKDASNEENAIRQFWRLYPDANVGIRTGSGFAVVLDVDPRHGGNESLKEIERKFGPLPRTANSLTGGGGQHLFFRHPGFKVRSPIGVFPGLDIRADGAYVVAPPSNHVSGVYKWADGVSLEDVGLAAMPELLLEHFTDNTAKTHRESDSEGKAREGERNTTLFRIAASLRAKGMSVAEIEAHLVAENQRLCVPPLSIDEVKKIAQSAGRYSPNASAESPWPEMTPLPPEEVAVPELADDLVPPAIRPWVLDVVERMQSSAEMLMAPAIVIFSGLIGRRLAIKPKRRDDWTVIPNLWGGIVAPPSAMKTPIMRSALAPIRKLELFSREKYLAEMADYEEKCREAEEKRPKEEYTGPRPIRRRRLTNDPTIEKLGELLSQNPNGLIVFRDELYGFLMGLEKAGRESDRQFYLEAFNGDGAYTFDRIGRGTIEIPALCISILGGIQPDRISTYFSETVKKGSGDDGFLSRFQVLVYPPRRKNWELVDRYPDAEARDRAFLIFERMDEMDFLGHGFTQSRYDDTPTCRFDSEAQEYFYDWLTRIQRRLRSGTIESPAFEAHLTKYMKLMPALALIFHIIDFCDPQRFGKRSVDVCLSSVQMAADWCEYLEAHATKIYADALRPQTTAAHALAKRIHKGDLHHRMTVRNLCRKEWTQLRDAKVVRSGLSLLEAHNWIRVREESPTGIGAPSEVIYLHPNLIGQFRS